MKESTLKIVNEEYFIFENGNRKIEVLGGIKLTGLERLKVTLKIVENRKEQHSNPYRCSIDLYNVEELTPIVKKISERFDMSEIEISDDFLILTRKLEEYRLSVLEIDFTKAPQEFTLSEIEIKEAKKYLKQKDLLKYISKDIENSGIIGEKMNSLIMYLIFTSRKTENPLHVISRGQSGIGKTYLQEKVAELIPEEDVIEITHLTSNSLYYLKENQLMNKLLLIEDLDGVEEALYPLRELQSKRRITKNVTVKDKKGVLKTQTLRVNGNVTVAAATTKEKIYEDNQNRCILIEIDSSKEQTERILDYQRRKSAGKINKDEQEKVKSKLKDIQRVLMPMKVINPFAEQLKLPNEIQNPRRTNQIYLNFIEIVTFFHQYQRKTIENKGERFIETTKEDIQFANQLLTEILLSKADDLTQSTRLFFEELKHILKEHKKETFKSHEVRELYKMHPSKLRRHLRELLEYGYLEAEKDKVKGYTYKIKESITFNEMKKNIESILKVK